MFYSASNKLQMVISIFALIVVTTATLQKFVWEYKYQNLKNEIIKIGIDNKMFLSDIKELIDENERLFDENEELKNKLKK